MTTRQIVRHGLIAALAVGLMAPPSAMATHNGTCPGFDDPSCNVRYVRDHTVRGVTDELAPTLDTIRDISDWAGAAVAGVLCDVFGAC